LSLSEPTGSRSLGHAGRGATSSIPHATHWTGATYGIAAYWSTAHLRHRTIGMYDIVSRAGPTVVA
jgi:hypothetical protein